MELDGFLLAYLGGALHALLPDGTSALPAPLPTFACGICPRRWRRPQLCAQRDDQLPDIGARPIDETENLNEG